MIDSPAIGRGPSREDIRRGQVRRRLGPYGTLSVAGVLTSGGDFVWGGEWFRDYNGVISDRRETKAATLVQLLEDVLLWEDERDIADASRQQT